MTLSFPLAGVYLVNFNRLWDLRRVKHTIMSNLGKLQWVVRLREVDMDEKTMLDIIQAVGG